MKIKSLLFASLVAIAFSSCEKIAGPGGTSTITGTVSGINETYGQYESIEITVTPGSLLEHGDYFIVNQLSGDNYYFYFNNPARMASDFCFGVCHDAVGGVDRQLGVFV